ncbi:MAG: TraR/DksA C4-type zinc finger protein [Gammaproteobacteria bacterium]
MTHRALAPPAASTGGAPSVRVPSTVPVRFDSIGELGHLIPEGLLTSDNEARGGPRYGRLCHITRAVYGVCIDCHQAIGYKRLRAYPSVQARSVGSTAGRGRQERATRYRERKAAR